MAIDIKNMTPKQLEAHVAKEQKLNEEIEALQRRLEDADYRTKTEKLYLGEQLQAKFRELSIHLGYEDE